MMILFNCFNPLNISMTTFDTIHPADSLEFCPTNGFHDLFVCGTYKLLDQEPSSKVPQTRTGQCLVFRVITDNETPSFQKLQVVDLPAIPDMKWCHRLNALPLLAVADSEGNITLYEWREHSLERTDSVVCATPDLLCLSLDWSNRRTGGSAPGSLVASLSNGNLCLLTAAQGSGLSVQETWHAHDYEPWIAAWNYWDTNVIYSGGDDLKLKAWDIRQGFTQPTLVNKRFEAGVTTIQSHPHVEHLFAVGSYDNTVRLFDARNPLIVLAQVDVGGGAWRVKWHPSGSRKQDLLVACMHDGFKVVKFSGIGSNSFDEDAAIIKRCDDHKSLAYGADWSYDSALRSQETLIGCCSFYDHKMSLWSA
ncbi:unnamed protein product [Cyclocybe aegerita]|uniref:methylated diphthine methylhydrolase n=1 Tax=Cyclocybe aegerita TaxID=1973307 RepID=A0A8S0VX26_CYCAE|nr:unnamed protein product [Cyclocybe aegerita]